MSIFTKVGEFHRAFGLPIRSAPTTQVPEAEMRQSILDEEVKELRDAIADNDITEIADAIGDIIYVACGTAHAYGVPLDEILNEIHRSNMSKLDADGKPIYREDGKVLKGPNFTPPQIQAILDACATPQE